MSPRKKLEPEFCARCGKEVNYRPPCQRRRSERAFCSRSCHMKTLNEELNPGRMTPETREKLRNARLDSGAGMTYAKQYGRHEHRIVAEQILGRELRPGEIVHHVDCDKRNNDPSNIMVFNSQSEHMKWHLEHDPRFKTGGGKHKVPTHETSANCV